MNATKTSQEIKIDQHSNEGSEASTVEKDLKTVAGALTPAQRASIGFAAGVVGAVAVVLASHVLSWLGLGVKGPIPFPIALKSPGIYLPLFWGGLWGIPLGLLIKAAWNRRDLFGFFYFLAPILATFLFFLPMGGAGYFGLKAAGPMFPLYVVLVNLPFGIVTALTAVAIIGNKVSQRAAIGFTAGVIGALAVVLFSHILFGSGLSAKLGVNAPVSLKSPDIYKPLFWGGLWGILFGLIIKTAWNRLYLVGFLYVLAPLLALFLFFLPMSGAGYFGLNKGPMFTLYLLLVNLPFGIVTAMAARGIIGKHP